MHQKHLLISVWIVFLLLASFACETPSTSETSEKSVPTTQAPPANVPAPSPQPPAPLKWELEAHYFLNDKNQQVVPLQKMQDWRTELLRAKLSDSDEAYDLFSHTGNGPGGAEWNTNADILLVLTGRDLEPGIPISVNMKLNEGSYTAKTVVEENGPQTFFSMEIPAKVWLPRLRKIRTSDYPLLYDAQTIEAASIDTESPIGVGNILVVELLITTNNGQTVKAHYKRAFHHASKE